MNVGIALLAAFSSAGNAAPPLSNYDVVWTTPSIDAAGSMPIGNGEVVLNVWVEAATGDLMFYIARTDALSEISRILKLGRIRVHLSTSPFKNANDFKQRLNLVDGRIEVSGQGTSLNLFVDSSAHVIHIDGQSTSPAQVTATLEDWRTAPRTLPKAEQGSAWSVHDAPFPLVESADIVLPGADLIWYHRNETSVVPKVWENQSLTGLLGTYDPLLHRTFGALVSGDGFARQSSMSIQTREAVKAFNLRVATHSAQTNSSNDWLTGVKKELAKSPTARAVTRTQDWWHAFWDRSWIYVSGDQADHQIPENDFPIRRGFDSNHQNEFPGEIREWRYVPHVVEGSAIRSLAAAPTSAAGTPTPDFRDGLTLYATIHPTELKPGRIFDKLTAGQQDGFLFDTYPGDGLRLIVGSTTLNAPKCLKAGETYAVAATYEPKTGEAFIYLNGKPVAHQEPVTGSAITRGYLLQRYVQACQGRGAYPIKFNGGYYTVEPKASGKDFNPDWRNWGDSHWYQNVRHMYHPMLASGDLEMMEPFFKLYEDARPLAEARSKAYHGSQGAYFPETMTPFGTYSGGDYGWDRTGHTKDEVLCPWWQYAWNQGPELVALMLDRWDYSRDPAFLKKRVLPMAESVLRYFDTRFKKDAHGRIVLDPTQVVETYWEGVVNDMPATAGLIAITNRLCALPDPLLTSKQRIFFAKMKAACPELPLETRDGQRQLAPAQKYINKTSNVENGELYAVWPFQDVTLAHPALMAEAKQAYARRNNRLDTGWGYDGNVAALLGMTEEAARILSVKCANSNPAYRWPATWGPNFDWLPDQNHGGNLLNTANLMLLQGEPLESGGAIRILPAWPKKWDVDFKLHAPGNTIVHCIAQAGKITTLEVTPESRRKDIVWPVRWQH